MMLMARHFWRYAFYRAYLDLISEASRYYLGWLWWFLEPIAMTGVFFVVFTYLRPSNMENFTYFILIGVTMWLWFANGVGNATDSLAVSRTIISQIRVPKLLFPIINVSAATLKQAFIFLVVLLGLGALLGPSKAWWTLPFIALAQCLLTLAVACTVALVCCWIRDVRFIVRSGLTLMMFCSGLFYPIDSMPPEWQPYFRANPMAVVLEQYRQVLLAAEPADLMWCAKVIVAGLLWLFAIKWLYDRFDLLLTRRVIA